MKNVIAKFLGLDKIQQENANLQSQVARLEKRLSHYDETDFTEIAKETMNYYDIASSVDMYDLAGHIDASDIAYNLDTDDVARCLDYESLSEHIDYRALQEQMTDALDMDILAQTVSEKIADRDGMHQLISEEIENQGAGNISTDAVQSMIDSAIQQFADSLEVMVSAKLNINK